MNNVRLALCGLLLLVLATYSNHFHNSFHFDDSHAVTDNPWIRDIHNIPHIFASAETFSALPANRSYRPVVTASLAIDYWMGHGLEPLWFHISTFVWFIVQLGMMFVLFRRILGEAHQRVALFATAIYAVHPVIAETVNYVIQRADLYSTLGVVAGLAIYVAAPSSRRYGLYLLPVIFGILSKLPAVVFPVLLFAWIALFESEALVRTLPALAATALASGLVILKTPPTYSGGASSAYGYIVTQPDILRGYFLKFFLPFGLSADTDHPTFTSIWNPDALTGFLFLGLLIAAIVWCTKQSQFRPIAFGLIWFLVTSLPTSLFPLAEVENDHRMFFPFVGLTLSVSWAAWLLVKQRRVSPGMLALVAGLVLAGLAAGAYQRNIVWHTEDTLWQNVSVNSPKNGRGLMNYGLTLMAKGNYPAANDLFQRALVLTPNYYILEINLGIVSGALKNNAEAERHFKRAIELAPADASARFFYARWLVQQGRSPEAAEHLRLATQMNPDYLDSSYLLMQIYSSAGDGARLRTEAQRVLSRFPSDPQATSWLAQAKLAQAGNLHAAPVTTPVSADDYLNESNALWRAGKFPECIAAAGQALKLKPDFAEAWNNIAAAYGSMAQWDNEIDAATKAIQLKSDFQLAKNNLAWAQSQKRKH